VKPWGFGVCFDLPEVDQHEEDQHEEASCRRIDCYLSSVVLAAETKKITVDVIAHSTAENKQNHQDDDHKRHYPTANVDVVPKSGVNVFARFVSMISPPFLNSTESKKKADVVEHPEVFDHIGLLVNELPSTAGLPFI
jgi:hypothetical protein